MQAMMALLFALHVHVQLASSQFYKCYARIYGRPSPQDCATVLNSMPDAGSQSPTPRLTDTRLFIEPQYLVPPFKRVETEEKIGIEQIPKFWRYRSCRIALMSVANKEGIVHDPEPISKWVYIEFNAVKVTEECAGRRLPQGGFSLIRDRLANAAVVIYVYAAGSPFESILNFHMVSGLPIFPPGLGEGADGKLAEFPVDGSSVYPLANVTRLLQQRR